MSTKFEAQVAADSRDRVATVASHWWAGEAEVVRVYFSRPRTPESDLFWLTAQAYKESYPLRVLPKHVREEVLRNGGVAPARGPAIETQLLQEAKHFKMLADLVSELRRAPIDLAELKPLPQDLALQDLRAGFRDHGSDLDRAAIAFTEGGGGAMFWELTRIGDSALEHRIAAIFREIYQDELSHGWPHLEEIARHARCEADWLRAEAIICDISRQRLRMRNEMFGNPLDATRVREIDEGRIEPWMAPSVI